MYCEVKSPVMKQETPRRAGVQSAKKDVRNTLPKNRQRRLSTGTFSPQSFTMRSKGFISKKCSLEEPEKDPALLSRSARVVVVL